MFQQFPLLRAALFAVLFTILSTSFDFFQDKAWQDEIWHNATVGLLTGGLLYFWQFRKTAQNESLEP